jgi:DNA-directed RNA polymerase specialized sigma24 family protein
LPPRISAVTLPELQRIYSQTYARFVREVASRSTSVEAAHHIIQEVFAEAARLRFSFQNEQSIVAWVKATLDSAPFDLAPSEASESRGVSSWADVLRRASISVNARHEGSPARPPTQSRSQLAAILRRIAEKRNAPEERPPYE